LILRIQDLKKNKPAIAQIPPQISLDENVSIEEMNLRLKILKEKCSKLSATKPIDQLSLENKKKQLKEFKDKVYYIVFHILLKLITIFR
jgi:hypothetical protein